MSHSIREEILSTLKALLIDATDAGDSVFRSRATALERQLSPAIVVRWSNDDPREKLGRDAQSRDLEAVIEIVTRGDEPDALADPLLVQVHALIFADPTLGGRADGCVPGAVSFEEDDADQTAGVTSATYVFKYLARASDPTRRP